METSNLVWSILTTIAGTALAVTGVGGRWLIRLTCCASRRMGPRYPSKPVEWPTVWSCATPARPLTVLEANRDIQAHRDHSCARKRVAFVTLMAAGRIVPDSSSAARIRGGAR